MVSLSAKQVKHLIRQTQEDFGQISHENWDAANSRDRRTRTEMWTLAADEAVPAELKEWREIIRILAQGWDYYGGSDLSSEGRT
jgi:hypothetical protein